MTTPDKPAFDVALAISRIYRNNNSIENSAFDAIYAELNAAYEAGRADAVAVTQVELTPEQRESLHCTNEVQIPGIAQSAVNQAADHWHGLYLQQCLKNKDDVAQPVQPATEFTSTMYDPAGLSNWLVGHDKGVRVTHRSGVFEQCHTERGFHANEAIALERLQARLEKKYSL